jgi:hypothetical protein
MRIVRSSLACVEELYLFPRKFDNNDSGWGYFVFVVGGVGTKTPQERLIRGGNWS